METNNLLELQQSQTSNSILDPPSLYDMQLHKQNSEILNTFIEDNLDFLNLTEKQKQRLKIAVGLEEYQNLYDEKTNYKIGESGQGRLYLRRNKVTNEEVVVKQIKNCNNPEIDIRSRKEYLTIIKMPSHENILRYNHCCYIKRENEVQIYFEMNKADFPLSKLILDKYFYQNPDRTLDLAHQILQGLKHLKQYMVYHLDLKPDNILVTKKENKFLYKIIDFGSIKRHFNANSNFLKLDHQTTEYITKYIVTTQQFMSPELIEQAEQKVEHYRLNLQKIDMYALGLILLICYHNNSANIAYTKIIHSWDKNTREIKHDKLKYLVEKLLEPEVKDRYNIISALNLIQHKNNIDVEYQKDGDEIYEQSDDSLNYDKKGNILDNFTPISYVNELNTNELNTKILTANQYIYDDNNQQKDSQKVQVEVLEVCKSEQLTMN